MAYTPGTIVEGTVKTITGFGAFVLLPDGQTGLVHISEVAPTFVTDIRRHLTEGQTVKVKVLSQGEGGKISLSARQANADSARRADGGTEQRRPERPAAGGRPAPRRAEPESFEEKLKQFMADSNSKISGSGQYEHRTRSRKR
ncbi:MAG: S1 RNA-binding domain-containing protein [Oscillospiraceae bacterium]|nr:S1 RNA-binding domain-containing protein [Oscillospiraceae bacterium]